MNTATPDYSPLIGWTPFGLVERPEGLFVEWMDLEDLDFEEAFFRRTIIRRSQRKPCQVALTPLEALGVLGDLVPALKPSGFIFHASRSGSSLLVQALRALPDTLVVSEADPVNHLLFRPERGSHPGAWQRQFRGLVACLGQARRAEQKRFVLKFSSDNTAHMAMILAAFPDVPWVYLYRDPVEVIASALQRPPHWLRVKDDPGGRLALLGEAGKALEGGETEVFAAEVYRLFAETALSVPGSRGRFLNYRDLDAERVAALALLWGVEVDQAGRAAIEETCRYDAKASSPKVFQDDSEAKRAMASAGLLKACRTTAAAAYQALERAGLDAGGDAVTREQVL